MKRIYIIILCVLAFVRPLYAQTPEQEEKIRVVVTDDGVLFNGAATTAEAVPELFWQALQRNPKIKYSISANSNNVETITRMQQLSTSVMEYLSRQQLVVGGSSSVESSLRIDVRSEELVVRLGKGELHQLQITQLDSLRGLVVDFISRREVGTKREFVLSDTLSFEHAPNDALVMMFATERSTEIDSLMQVVSQTVAEGYDHSRNMLAERVLNLPYSELDNRTRSVFMAAVPKRTQSNVVQTKVVRQIRSEEDNSKAVDLLKMCLVKADGTFAWEGKSYDIKDMAQVLGADFDTSKFMLDSPLVAMIMEQAFGKRAPKLNDINTATLMKVLGFSMPGLAGGVANVVAHSVKVLRDNPELVDAYVPIAVTGLDLVAKDDAGREVQQVSQAQSLEVRFTVVGNESCRSGNKKLTISILDLATGEELQQQVTAEYQNVDLLVTTPFTLTKPLQRGTFLVSVHRGKQPLSAIEVEMM